MAKTLKKGDKVEWGTSQGKTKGTVKKKLTSPTKIKGHKVAASKSNPEYLVESSKSGDKAAHKAESLKKVSKSSGTKTKKTAAKKAGSSKKSTTAKKTAKPKSSGAKKSTKSGATKRTASTKKSATAKKSAKNSSSAESQQPKDKDQVIKDFKSVVNIPPRQLERWLEQPESRKVGFKDEKKGESVGHESGRRILRILAKRRDKLSDEDLGHMQKVVGYVHRHLAQKPKGDIVASNWRYSLMNWGHDPTK